MQSGFSKGMTISLINVYIFIFYYVLSIFPMVWSFHSSTMLINMFGFLLWDFRLAQLFFPLLTPEPQAPSKTSCKIRSISYQNCTDLVQKATTKTRRNPANTASVGVLKKRNQSWSILLGLKKNFEKKRLWYVEIILKKHTLQSGIHSGTWK